MYLLNSSSVLIQETTITQKRNSLKKSTKWVNAYPGHTENGIERNVRRRKNERAFQAPL
jgi:hypothetical protein